MRSSKTSRRIRMLSLLTVGAMTTTALAACGDDGGDTASEGGLTKVTLATPPGFYNSLPFQLAQDEGVFAEHGVEMDVVDVTNGGTLISSVLSGSADMGMNISPPLVNGDDGLRFFCGNSDKFYADLLVKPESDLPTFEEAGSLKAVFESMKGKKVGVITVGGVADLLVQGAIKEAGVDPKSMDFISVGAGPAAVTAFETGQVDVLYGYAFITQQLVGEGKAKMLVDLHKESPVVNNLWSAGFLAEKSWIEKDPKTAQAVCDAYGEGIEMMKDPANKDAVNALLTKNFNLKGDKILDLAREQVNGAVTNEIDKDKVNQTYKTLHDLGAITTDKTVTYDDVILLPETVK